MSETDQFLHSILGDSHQGRLIDKLGNFATENFGEKGLTFFNTLTAAQVYNTGNLGFKLSYDYNKCLALFACTQSNHGMS